MNRKPNKGLPKSQKLLLWFTQQKSLSVFLACIFLLFLISFNGYCELSGAVRSGGSVVNANASRTPSGGSKLTTLQQTKNQQATTPTASVAAVAATTATVAPTSPTNPVAATRTPTLGTSLPQAPGATAAVKVPASISVAKEMLDRQITVTVNDQQARRFNQPFNPSPASAPKLNLANAGTKPTIAVKPIQSIVFNKPATYQLKPTHTNTLVAPPKPLYIKSSTEGPDFAKIKTPTSPIKPISELRITTSKPINTIPVLTKNIGVNQLTMPKTLAMPKPIVTTLKPIQTPKLAITAIPKITPINTNVAKPITSIKPISMPKPVVVNALKPISMPNIATTAIPKITPIANTPITSIKPIAMPKIKPIDNILVKPIASIKPLTMPKPIVNTLKPIPAQSLVKYTIPAITPLDKVMLKPIASIKPLTMPKPIATNIRSMPAPKYAHIDVPSLNYMGKTFNVEVPKIETITMPKMQPVKVAPIRLSEVEIPKYTMPQVAVIEIPKYAMPQIAVKGTKYQPINTQYIETTIKLYDAKVMHDASRINSLIAPGNSLQKYFNGNHMPKIDLTRFVQNAPNQRKEIITRAQAYANSAEIRKLEALDTWRKEYDKFMALSSNISNVVKETGQVDPASLDYLENVKENLDTLTRNITDMGVEKTAMQQVIKNSGETVTNPLMKDKAPVMMPTITDNPSLRVLPINTAPRIDIINGLTHGISNLLSSPAHAEEQ